jgi:arylsulfatase A-like enzyme
MNVILIVIDTLCYDYVGANGNDWIETPNMDRLAAESWVFDNAYAASFPTIPHRTDVATGRYGGPFHTWQPLAFDAPTLPRALSALGYCTQLIHDTPHLVNGGHHFDYPFHAWTFVRGAEVDRAWIMDHMPWPENWDIDSIYDDLMERPTKNAPVEGYWVPAYLATYAWTNRKRKTLADWNCARLFRTGAEFLADNANRENFFLWLDCFDPHEPWDSPPEFMRKYDKTEGYDGTIDPRSFLLRGDDLPEVVHNRIRAAYAAKVSWMDHCLGELLDTLDRTGLGKNTAVILTSDHGTNDGSIPGRGFGKKNPLESEAHVPLMLRVPDGGSGRCDAVAQPQDFFATVMKLAGSRAPTDIESYDLLGVARGDVEPARRVALTGRDAGAWSQDGSSGIFGVYDGTWCLEMNPKPGKSILRARDLHEDQTLGNEDVVERLRATAIDELEHRGADPEIVSWLRRDGEGKLPGWTRMHDHHPSPSGYAPYFMRLYGRG